MFPPCIYCRAKPSGSREHLILSSIGGRRSCRSIDCRDCNGVLGVRVDEPFRKQVEPLVNLTGGKTGRGRSVAPVKGIDSGEGFKVNLEAGVPVLVGPVIKQVGSSLTIWGDDEEEVLRIARARCATQELVLEKQTHFRDRMEPPRAQLGGDDSFRLVVKSVLNLVATMIPAASLRDGRFERAIRYVRDGVPLPEGWVGHDYSTVLPDCGRLSPLAHRLFAFAHRGHVFGFFELLGRFRFSAILTASWVGGDFGVCYPVDQVSRSHATIPLTPLPDIDPPLPSPVAPVEDVRGVMPEFYQQLQRVLRSRSIERIVGGSYRRHAGITDESIREIVEELACARTKAQRR